MHHFFDIATAIVTICSILHTMLPPWEALNDFPRAQKYYKLAVYVIGYLALSGRSTLYKSISIQNPAGVNSPEVKQENP